MSTKFRTHGKGVVVWILLAVMVLGLGGFGISSFSGGSQKIGSVGDTDITVNDYARALQRQMNAVQQQIGRPLTVTEAKSYGIDQQVQAQLFAQAALSEEARRLGLSIGDAEVARQITGASAFHGPNGQFDRETYRMALRQQGYTEGDFERQVRDDIARNLLQGAIASGISAPKTLVDAYADYITESRPVSWAEVTEMDLTQEPAEPDEAALQSYYDAHQDRYTSPESREITYVWLTPDMLKDEATPDDTTLRAMYDQRSDEYRQPERRLVDKLVFPSEEEAQKAADRLNAGQISFEDLARERGLDITDIDLGEVTRGDLGNAADAVFALTEPGVVGPVATDLGPALFKMNGILPADDTTFEQAKPDLEAEATIDQARAMITAMTADLEDRLASGATLEDMAKDTKMELGHISMTPETKDGIAAYEDFRTAANSVTQQDFPELRTFDDGGVFALQLDGITPAAPIPFAEVRDRVIEDWRNDELARLKAERAEEVVAAVDAGAVLADQGLLVTNSAPVERTGFIEGAPTTLIGKIFETEPGKAAMVTDQDRVFVLVPGASIAADPAAPETAQLRDALAQRLGQSMSNDLATLFATAAEAKLGLNVNTAAINAVQAQMQ
ncbi:peptidylprolyl isomerase [Paenirhodobacter populi]|uniref:Parvulin-like PPIase n=1 Tax=Paenirhodobacter populi TaxID=2306993 RepID=A0A443IT15_9RHOB|nr:peptidylprolyl isomerase [Sinirhodobacter populi]RWR10505.1 peptidylprolyl isomerase [Sinirhodobacter populi]